LINDIARRIGIEKRGNQFSLFVSLAGEPMTQYGPPIELDSKEPFYVGFGSARTCRTWSTRPRCPTWCW
jgi:hypothetical protein